MTVDTLYLKDKVKEADKYLEESAYSFINHQISN